MSGRNNFPMKHYGNNHYSNDKTLGESKAALVRSMAGSKLTNIPTPRNLKPMEYVGATAVGLTPILLSFPFILQGFIVGAVSFAFSLALLGFGALVDFKMDTRNTHLIDLSYKDACKIYINQKLSRTTAMVATDKLGYNTNILTHDGVVLTSKNTPKTDPIDVGMLAWKNTLNACVNAYNLRDIKERTIREKKAISDKRVNEISNEYALLKARVVGHSDFLSQKTKNSLRNSYGSIEKARMQRKSLRMEPSYAEYYNDDYIRAMKNSIRLINKAIEESKDNQLAS